MSVTMSSAEQTGPTIAKTHEMVAQTRALIAQSRRLIAASQMVQVPPGPMARLQAA